MSTLLISRLKDLKCLMDDMASVGDIVNALQVAATLAEDAVTDLVATELAMDQLLEPATDSDFWGDEGIK